MNLIQWDKALLVNLNAHHSSFWDGVMWMATDEINWIPFFLILLYTLYKAKGKEFFLILIAITLTVVLCDQVSGIFKEWIARPRPSREPDIMHQLHIVNNYRGGKYGFFSSHAANTFGIAVLLAFVLKNTLVTSILLIWAAFESYTRIYLGVHYPLDILTGMLFGILSGYLIYRLHTYVISHFNLGMYDNKAQKTNGLLLFVFLMNLFMIFAASQSISDFLL